MMKVLILLLCFAYTAQAQTNPFCTKRGHVVPFFLDKSGGVVSRQVEDFADSTIVSVSISEKTEEGVCARCGETVIRVDSARVLFRERKWIDSTKFIVDSTGVVRKRIRTNGNLR